MHDDIRPQSCQYFFEEVQLTNISLDQSNASLLSVLTCALGLRNATVIVIVRAVQLQQATAGGYTGTLSILLTAQ